MTRANIIVGGVLGFFMLYALMLYFTWRPIEQDIAQRTAVELKAGAHQWAMVQTHQRGRDVLVTGSAPSALAGAQAVAMAHKSWGVRTVEARIDVAPSASLAPPSLPASISSEDRLEIQGMVGSDQRRSQVVDAVTARFGQHLALDEDLVVAAATSPVAPVDIASTPEVVPTSAPDPAMSCQSRFDELLQRNTISFASSSAQLKPDSTAALDEVTVVLGDCPASRVRVEGHTDATGSAHINDRLSQRRAESVRDYLVAKGLDPQRFEVEGVGSREPVADNASPAGRALNRRIELRVVR